MIVHTPTAQVNDPYYSNVTSEYVLSFQIVKYKKKSSTSSFEHHNNNTIVSSLSSFVSQYLGTRPSGEDYVYYYCKGNQTLPIKQLSDLP